MQMAMTFGQMVRQIDYAIVLAVDEYDVLTVLIQGAHDD